MCSTLFGRVLAGGVRAPKYKSIKDLFQKQPTVVSLHTIRLFSIATRTGVKYREELRMFMNFIKLLKSQMCVRSSVTNSNTVDKLMS
jgi:hypothetical protein